MLKFNFTINKNIFSICLTAMLLAEACSASSNENSKRDAPVAVAEPVTTIENNQLTVPNTATAVSADEKNDELAISFIASNDQGTVTVSAESSPVAEWFANQPGEVPLDLVDADAADAVSVAEEMISFWFSKTVAEPSSIYVSAGEPITDSAATSCFVKSRFWPPVLVADTITTTGSTNTISSAPETFEPPSSATSFPTTSTATTIMTTVEDRQTKAEEILQVEEMDEIDQPISMPCKSLEKIKSNLLSMFDVRGFLSTTAFIVCRK